MPCYCFCFAVLPLGIMVNVRRVYSDDDKRTILAALLRNIKPDLLSDGVTKKVAAQYMVPLRVVQRVWFDHLQGIENVCNKKPLNCWCKRIEVDPQAIMQIPPSKRTTLKDLAHELNMSISTCIGGSKRRDLGGTPMPLNLASRMKTRKEELGMRSVGLTRTVWILNS